MKQRLIVANFADDAEPPKASATRAPEQEWWTPEELASFLAFSADHPLAPLLRLTALTGMRRGEVCALRWSDVDWNRGRIEVRRQLLLVRPEPMFVEHTKTKKGRRSVAVDKGTMAVVRAHRDAQVARLGEDRLIFNEPDGSPLNRLRCHGPSNGASPEAG